MHRRTKPGSDVVSEDDVGDEYVFPEIEVVGNGGVDVQLLLFVGALVLLLLDRL